MTQLHMLFLIINPNDEKKFLKIIDKYKVGFKVVMHGTGTASSSLLEYFGLKDERKTIVTAVIPTIVCKNILRDIEQKENIQEPGNGIAFTIPLSSSTKYILDFYQNHEMEDIEMEEVKQHLIVTITNQGYAEKVMTEAKKVGATGGTTLSGRGLENEKVIKFLNIAIEPEKDVVFILVDSEKKTDIMNAIVENCGLKTPGAGICFSLPVDHVLGVNKKVEVPLKTEKMRWKDIEKK